MKLQHVRSIKRGPNGKLRAVVSRVRHLYPVELYKHDRIPQEQKCKAMRISASLAQGLRAVGTLWLATLAGAVLSFLTQTSLARHLGPSAFGTFVASWAIASMVAPTPGVGLSQFLLRAYGEEGWGAVRWLRSSFRLFLILELLSFGAVVAWAGFFAPDNTTRLALLFLLPILISVPVVELLSSRFRLEERHAALAALQVAPHGIRFLIAVLVIQLGSDDPLIVAIGYGVGALLLAGAAWPLVAELFRGRIALQGHGLKPEVSRNLGAPSLANTWARVWPYGIAAIIYPIYFQVGTVLVRYLASPEAAGAFGLSIACLSAVYLLPSTIYQKYLLARLHRWELHRPEHFRAAYRFGSIAMLGLGMLIGGGMAVFGPLAAPLLFGQQFSSVSDLLVVLSLCVPLRFTSTAIGSSLLSPAGMKLRAGAMAGAACVIVCTCIALIPKLGPLGAAIGTVAGESALLLAFYVATRHRFL